MANLILSTEKLRYYEELCNLCDDASLDGEFCDTLWQDLLVHKDLYDELLYFMEHADILDKAEVCGEHLTDYYVRELRRYNVAHDSAKNGPDCDKTRILLLTVRSMIDAK
ncbi:MAG: hypothetical protein K6G07_01435, partial [Lachnospiraceae bacterium]|nr:hypothetical protein [Lachnospiraceae bacterium]